MPNKPKTKKKATAPTPTPAPSLLDKHQAQLREFLKMGFTQITLPQWLTHTGREPGTLYYALGMSPDSCIEVLPDGRRARLHTMKGDGSTRWVPLVCPRDLMFEIRHLFNEQKHRFDRQMAEGICRLVREEIEKTLKHPAPMPAFMRDPYFMPPSWWPQDHPMWR